jgi:mRNA interferase MazF
MTLYDSGDVVLINFPFTSGTGSKHRPALVVLDAGDMDLVVARITTQSAGTPFDVAVSSWQAAGLLGPSNVRLHKLATLLKSDVHRKLGRLNSSDQRKIADDLQQIVDQWQ